MPNSPPSSSDPGIAPGTACCQIFAPGPLCRSSSCIQCANVLPCSFQYTISFWRLKLVSNMIGWPEAGACAVIGYVFRFFLPDVNLGPWTVISSTTDQSLLPSLVRFMCSRLPSLDVRMNSRSRCVFPPLPWNRFPLWWKRRENWSRLMAVSPYLGLLTSSMATSPYLKMLVAVSPHLMNVDYPT